MKIMLTAVCPVLLGLAVTLAVLVWQQRRLHAQVEHTIQQQAHGEAAKIAQNVHVLCVSSEQRNQRELTYDLGVARELLARSGGVSLAAETVAWQVVNQFTKESGAINLPKMLVGQQWLGRISGAAEAAPVVDDATRATGNFCTIFQRMNDAGDMLRVCTSVLSTDGKRAIGTYIPARNPDGTDNAVVQAVLRGQSFRGRAFVVNQWHSAAYEPLWDAGKTRVIGMLYVGVGLETINRELREGIMRIVVGKTGYVFVVGAAGDERGKYLVSQQGKRDGENIWEMKDADGRPVIQSIIAKGRRLEDGAVDFETYAWQNPGEPAPRAKFAAITSFSPWNWIIGAGAYESDFAQVRDEMYAAEQKMLLWVAIAAGAIAALAAAVAVVFATGLSRRLVRSIADLGASSEQVS